MLQLAKLFKLFSLSVILLLMASCVRDVDFDQADEFAIEPVVEVSILYFDLKASTLGEITNNDLGGEIEETTRLDLFSDPFVEENLMEATFTFEFTNTIQRAFSAVIILLDEADNELRRIPIYVGESNGQENVVRTIVNFDATEVALLKQMENLTVELGLEPGNPELDSNSPGNLYLKSAGTFFLNIDAD
ncbi:hypothetical protein HX109_02940 [Galbibacter sp. BG1]|uniref:hypothetical protein n=1 Tax=Galbibacter sp. BG1 TaxID=1170699 RepID=UPI0015BC6C6C|nr:hypothetical protein [Galbibacter sp. BG1]QLE00567.1 hypothetical protein HX109_02940 [Galbibacter sp. BG1]